MTRPVSESVELVEKAGLESSEGLSPPPSSPARPGADAAELAACRHSPGPSQARWATIRMNAEGSIDVRAGLGHQAVYPAAPGRGGPPPPPARAAGRGPAPQADPRL